jgi:hypothetical protein
MSPTLTPTTDEAVYLIEGLNMLQQQFTLAAESKLESGDLDAINFMMETMDRCSDIDDLVDRLLVIVEAGGYHYNASGKLQKKQAA